MLFRLAPLRFSFIAREGIYFPAGQSSNILRGAFGVLFRKMACLPDCPGDRTCAQRAACAYARLFEPTAGATQRPAPSGFADYPRPFVFRATHLDGQTISANGCFHFDLNLFDTSDPTTISYLILTFAQLAREGLGTHRSKVELTRVSQMDSVLYQSGVIQTHADAPALTLDLSSTSLAPISCLRVKFVTPMELKSGSHLAPQPDFAILAARARDRISTLRELYSADGPLPIDFRAFAARAALIKMTRCAIHNVNVQRRSSRTGQTHPIGGFIGEAEYEGHLTEFVPYLAAAQWTGIGRQTVWGKGQIELFEEKPVIQG